METIGHELVNVRAVAKPLPVLKHRRGPKPWEVTTSGLTREQLWARINTAMSTLVVTVTSINAMGRIGKRTAVMDGTLSKLDREPKHEQVR
jgi:hypothetical protein